MSFKYSELFSILRLEKNAAHHSTWIKKYFYVLKIVSSLCKILSLTYDSFLQGWAQRDMEMEMEMEQDRNGDLSYISLLKKET